MEWAFIVALVLAIPIILFPVAFVWYINVGGIYAAIRKAKKKKTAQKKEKTGAVAHERRAMGYADTGR